jgi:predicted kinase
MKTLIMMAGIPGSGKSTWAREYASKHPNTLIVDTDETRKSITGSYQIFPPDRHIIYDKMIQLANDWFASHDGECSVIEDSTFTDNYRRVYYMERIKGFDYSCLFMVKMHDYSLCYERNKMRRQEKWVPENVIADFIKNYEEPSAEVKKLFNDIKVEYWN